MLAIKLIILAYLSTLPFLSIAHSEVSLNDSRVWRRARNLPIRQQVWSFESSYQQYADRFSKSGNIEPLGRAHARKVTWGQLLHNFPSGRAEIVRKMQQHGLSDTDVAATAAYQIDRSEVGMLVDWAYGLTDNWMIGFQLPLVYRRTHVVTSVELTPALVSSTQGRGGVGAFQSGDLHNKVEGMAKSELTNSGYDAVPDQRASWDWGDISLMSQFSLVETHNYSWSLQQMVRVPTARNPSIADYLQSGGDDGQVDVGVSSLFDYRRRRWVSGFRVGYVMQLPDTVRMRVSSERFAVDPSVHRDLGDWIWGAADTEYSLTNRLNVNFEYAFLSKAEDTYSNSGASYQSLGTNTTQELHQTRLGLVYRIGSRGARSGIESKTLASVGYTYPLLGRNSINASRASIELISYF